MLSVSIKISHKTAHIYLQLYFHYKKNYKLTIKRIQRILKIPKYGSLFLEFVTFLKMFICNISDDNCAIKIIFRIFWFRKCSSAISTIKVIVTKNICTMYYDENCAIEQRCQIINAKIYVTCRGLILSLLGTYLFTRCMHKTDIF